MLNARRLWWPLVLSAALACRAADGPAWKDARVLFETGRVEEARQALEKLAAGDPKDAEVDFLLGECALHRNDPVAAVRHFEQAVAKANVSRYFHRLGDAYGRHAQVASVFSALGLAKKCVAAYERAVQLDPLNVDARFSLFMYYRSAPALVGGGAAKAAAEATEIAKLDPNAGRVARAALHVTQKKYDQARAEISTLEATDLAQVSGANAYLSDVNWASARVGWGNPARNHAWFDEKSHPGVVLIVHGRLYRKGLYAHAESNYTFALDGAWKKFSATVGLRDGAHPQGSAIFIVRADGRELYRSKLLRAGASERVQVEVSGAKQLELIAAGGEGHIHNAWAVWAAPLVER